MKTVTWKPLLLSFALLLLTAGALSATCLPLCGAACEPTGSKCCICCAPPGGPITCSPAVTGLQAASLQSASLQTPSVSLLEPVPLQTTEPSEDCADLGFLELGDRKAEGQDQIDRDH